MLTNIQRHALEGEHLLKNITNLSITSYFKCVFHLYLHEVFLNLLFFAGSAPQRNDQIGFANDARYGFFSTKCLIAILHPTTRNMVINQVMI